MESTNKNKLSKKSTIKPIFLSIIFGAITGFINGLFGGGGGMIVVPFLSKLLKFETDKAHATAILIILPLSILSTILYASFGNLDLKLAIPVGIGVVSGGALGAFLLKKISNKWLTIIFSLVMAFAGVKLIFS